MNQLILFLLMLLVVVSACGGNPQCPDHQQEEAAEEPESPEAPSDALELAEIVSAVDAEVRAVLGVVAEHKAALDECFAQDGNEAGGPFKPEGDIYARGQVSAKGRIDSVIITPMPQGSPLPPAVGFCLAEEVRGWDFPEQLVGKDVEVPLFMATSHDSLQALLGRDLDLVEECFTKAVDAGNVLRDSEAFVIINLAVSPDGENKRTVKVYGARQGSLDACIEDVAKGWNLPPRSDGNPRVEAVNFPLPLSEAQSSMLKGTPR